MSVSKIKLPERKSVQFESVSEFEMGPMIGDGGFAKVYRVTHKASQIEYALKVMELSTMNEKDLENIEKELEIHSSLDFPLIVKLEDFFKENEKIFVVLEMASNGNLYKYMFKQYQLPLPRVLQFWKGTVRAIQYLHANEIYMRDLKPENILIDKDLKIKLCDFGWASRMSDEQYRSLPGGTYIYMSPENLRGELQGFASDMWSLGVLLYELIHYHEPFKIGLSAEEQLSFIRDKEIRMKKDLPEHVKSLILELIEWDESKRPTADQVLGRPWLAEIADEQQVSGEDLRPFF